MEGGAARSGGSAAPGRSSAFGGAGKVLRAGRNGNRREEGGADRGKGKMREVGAPGTG